MKASLACATAALLLAACASNSGPARRYYTLDPPSATAPVAQRAALRGGVLLVAPVAAAPFYDGRQIAFSSTDGMRGQYQFSHWAQPPAESVTTALTDSLGRAGLFADVATPSPGLHADWLLSVRLVELYHDAQRPPGVVRLALSAELVDLHGHALVARRTFTACANAATNDADGAVAGARTALATSVGAIVGWIDRTVPASGAVHRNPGAPVPSGDEAASACNESNASITARYP
ncbi:MAG TPA: ABC-type transport auxiliary lipoprotein family protein [Caldimonas sp.]|nr:ABC-type transport auxiliary lipoprotein family protein [Caldimonas sp.]